MAARHGVLLSYLGKPINGRGGSGFHVNMSIADDAGNNLFADESAEDGISELAKAVTAGLLHHLLTGPNKVTEEDEAAADRLAGGGK